MTDAARIVADYTAGVLDRSIVTGELVRLAVERHVRDLARQDTPDFPYYFDPAAAQHFHDFCGLVKHSKGKWAGEVFVPSPYQVFRHSMIFGWMRCDNDLRRFRFAYCEEARKGGKSTDAAVIGNYLLTCDGESGAEVYSAATKRDQARIVHRQAVSMVRSSPSLKAQCTLFKDVISLPRNESLYQPLGADVDGMDGLNPHGAIIDELHAHKTRRCWDVLESAVGARSQPLIFAITTAGFDQTGICYEIRDYCIAILRGDIVDEQWFAFIATLDEADDWRDRSTWIKANPNLGVTTKMEDLEAQCHKAEHQPSAQNEFRTKRLNQWVGQSERWIDMVAWDACREDYTVDHLKGVPCYGGLDLSSRLDLTAFSIVVPDPEADVWRCFTWCWIPATPNERRDKATQALYDQWVASGHLLTNEGERVNQSAIRVFLNELRDDGFDIAEIAYDPADAGKLVTELNEEDGFKMIACHQGCITMSAPMKELEADVVSGRVRHNGHPVLRWCLDNMATYTDTAMRIRPNKKAAGKKIDAVTALIMAKWRESLATDGGPSYYEKEPFTFA